MYPSPPFVIALLGAPGTGVRAMAAALQSRAVPGALQILCLRAAPPSDHPPDLTLLMGLDLPCPAARRPAQEAADARLRKALAHAEVGYRVVYGYGEQRLVHALQAIKSIARCRDIFTTGGPLGSEIPSRTGEAGRLRAWNCEKCSDPQCEHRLFTALAGLRAGPGVA